MIIFAVKMSNQQLHSYGIVLHAVRYGDTSVIVEIYTQAMGAQSFIVRQLRGAKARLRASLWQPLTLVEVVWDHRPMTDLQKPREVSLWMPWKEIPFQPVKTTIALFLGEFLWRALRSEQENAPLFDYMLNALTWLDESDHAIANFHIVFLLHLTRFLGFHPNVDEWEEGDCFDLMAATFVRERPRHPYYIEAEEARLVPKFLRMDIRSMQAVGLNGAMRRRALELIILFYRLHIPEFPELKSLAVMSEVFGK